MQATWNITDALAAFLLRLAFIGLLTQLMALPEELTELLDRLVMIGLTLGLIYWRGAKPKDYGMSGRAIGRNCLWGVLIGGCLLLISVYTEQLAAEWFSFQVHPWVLALRSASKWTELVPVFFMAGFLSPIAEEFFYRILLYLPLKKAIGRFFGVLAAAIIFSLLHFSSAWLGELLLVAIALTLLYERTESILSAMTAHVVLNVGKLLLLLGGYL